MRDHYEISKFLSINSGLDLYGQGGNTFESSWKTPKEIKEYLDKHVVGQHKAKEVLATAIYNRDMRLFNRDSAPDGVAIDKSNIMMLGPTGCGKTYLIKTLAKCLNVPYAIEDATTFTSSGYIGRDVPDMLDRLLSSAITMCPYDPLATSEVNSLRVKRMAESGIIYLDEIDKLARPPNSQGSKGVGDVEVQEELLKLLEGSIVQMGGVKSMHKNQGASGELNIKEIDTTHILFVIGGSFYGIEEIIARRLEGSCIGYNTPVHSKEKNLNILHCAKTEDLVTFGMLPELVGRFAIQVSFSALTERDLVHILTGVTNNLIAQYCKLLAYSSRHIIFSRRALKRIATLAIKSRTGARGLKRILDASLQKTMFEAPSDPNGPIIYINADNITE